MQAGSQLVWIGSQGIQKLIKNIMEVGRLPGGMREAGIRNYGVSGIADVKVQHGQRPQGAHRIQVLRTSRRAL